MRSLLKRFFRPVLSISPSISEASPIWRVVKTRISLWRNLVRVIFRWKGGCFLIHHLAEGERRTIISDDGGICFDQLYRCPCFCRCLASNRTEIRRVWQIIFHLPELFSFRLRRASDRRQRRI